MRTVTSVDLVEKPRPAPATEKKDYSEFSLVRDKLREHGGYAP
jgi:hypothetical protein